MRADFIASEGGHVFGGPQQSGTQRDLVGVASQAGRQSAEKAKQWIASPTAAPTDPLDFATRVVPHSMAKAVVGGIEAPIQMAGRIVGPLADAVGGIMGGAPVASSLAEGAWGAVKGAGQDIADISKFLGTKAGIVAPDEQGNLNPSVDPQTVGLRILHEGLTDPVGTGMAVLGVGAGVKGAISKGGDLVSRVGLQGNPELAALSKTHDVPLTAGEESGSVGLKNLETQLERVPFGTRGFREMQSSKLATAANNFIDRFAPGNTTDIPDQIQMSMLKTLKAGKDSINSIQSQINKEVTMNVTEPIAPENLRVSTVKLLDQFPDIFDRLPSTPLKSKLTAIAEGASDGEKTSPILDAQGQPVRQTVPAELPWDQAMMLREQLNDYLGRAYKSGGAVGNKEIYQLSELKRGLDADINSWGRNSSNSKVVDLFKQRNAEYIKKVVPFKDAVVRTATGTAFDTDLIYKKFIQPDRPQLARKLMGSLDEEGKGLVRYSVLKKALESGQEAKPGVPFSPAKFAREIERLGPTIDAIFSDQDKQMVQGFARLTRVAERAGHYAENPPTGIRANDTGITVGLAGGVLAPFATAGALAVTKLMSSLLTSAIGKKILLKAARTPEASPGWAGILEAIKQFTNKPYEDSQVLSNDAKIPTSTRRRDERR